MVATVHFVSQLRSNCFAHRQSISQSQKDHGCASYIPGYKDNCGCKSDNWMAVVSIMSSTVPSVCLLDASSARTDEVDLNQLWINH